MKPREGEKPPTQIGRLPFSISTGTERPKIIKSSMTVFSSSDNFYTKDQPDD